METHQLQQGRKQLKLTQQEAASKLGVTQPYLSLLEKGERKIPARLARKAATLYRLSATALPLTTKATSSQLPALSRQVLAEELAALGYPGFSYLRSRRKRNPAEVLLDALAQNDLEPRLTEALPWIVLQYTNLDWDWLLGAAKLHNLQNRLGFVTRFALRVVESGRANASKIPVLKKYADLLE